MKKISQTALKKLVKEKNLEVSRGKVPPKPKVKEPEKKIEKPDLASGIMVKSGTVIVDMAQSLAASADKMAESNIMVAKIAKTIQESLKETPEKIVEKPKKRKWKFTPHRNYDQIIQYITVEEL